MDVDFDPTTEEGREDLNTTVDEDYDSLIQNDGEGGESWNERISARFRSGASYAKRRLVDLWKTRNPRRAVPEYMELHNLPVVEDSSTDRLRVSTLLTKYPDLDENLIQITTDERGKQQISFFSSRTGSWTKPERLYNEDKTVRKNVDSKIRSGKYKQIEIQLQELDATANTLREEEERNTEQIRKNNDERAETSNQERLRAIDRQNEELSERNSTINETLEQNQMEMENLEERMSLKDRVKAIFKKYGFTATAVLSAVGVVIGVIVSNLKAGLTSVAKGVGNGLKAIGKKMGEILPGMVGAIASFIFRTAGEVVGFLAKNAWLLIVAIVLYFVEQFKKRRR